MNAILHGNGKDFSKVIMGHVIDEENGNIDTGRGEGRPKQYSDPTLPENLVKDCGRGLIVRHYADKVDTTKKGTGSYNKISFGCLRICLQIALAGLWVRKSTLLESG